MKPYPNDELERMSKREIIRLYKRTVEQFNDAVPVIRCVDCKYHKTESYQEGRYVFIFCERDRERRIFDMNDDDYCSKAEREEK